MIREKVKCRGGVGGVRGGVLVEGMIHCILPHYPPPHTHTTITALGALQTTYPLQRRLQQQQQQEQQCRLHIRC